MDKKAIEAQFPGLPEQVVHVMADHDAHSATCGGCAMFDAEQGFCTERNFTVKPSDPECQMYIPS